MPEVDWRGFFAADEFLAEPEGGSLDFFPAEDRHDLRQGRLVRRRFEEGIPGVDKRVGV